MSTPLRVNDNLFQEAEAEGSLLNRSTARQVEFWAMLGKRVAHSITPADILALMQGIAEVHIRIPASQPVNPEELFAAVDKAISTGKPGRRITRDTLYYEASKSRPGLLDQVMPDGTRRTGHFNSGSFLPE
ncbi:MAG TPA: hypothetical protein ENI68_06735 [Gammaproteobacteria bacterium]|nr:hypothetical protein [Gammaproteobacteria bacterium]